MLKKIKLRNTLIFIFVFLFSVFLYIAFLKSPYFSFMEGWISKNRLKYIFFLLIFKIISVLWPPLTGGVATLGSIPFLGWKLAYFVDFLGSMIGGVITYHLGKKYGYAILSKFFNEDVIEKIKKIKVKKKREIEAVFVYRILFGTTILEAIYYGAGVLNIRFSNFMLGAAFSHL